MGLFILRRVGIMLLTALCLTFLVFFLTNLYPNLEKLAKTQGNFRMSDEQVESFLEKNGYLQATPIKYGEWLGVLPSYRHTNEDGTVQGRCILPGQPRKKRPISAASCRDTGAIRRSSKTRSRRLLEPVWR